ncbi:AB hydrolase superfamily protein [Colletotrichum spaethianum]|uniref:AB hydrolase superfamily protein n=1 Tax=Colletotrichum spaethianum TaxID=700344 RepID=A0AA37L5C3_9PEZI|nr:AB hydrolase superfamily protein [Colletotrichum spaethianum]GKT40259.1 AB hydrolase superfamily protein [Colletotrichum spaethianum]
MSSGVGHEALNPINPALLPRLEPKFIELYNTHVANTPNKPIDLDVLRKVYSRLYGYGTAPAPDCAKEYETTVPGWEKYPGDIKIRVYVPHGEQPAEGWPVHFDFHGGGWGLGDLETESHICRHICVKASVIVVDVDYRLVPEFPFPTGLYDCFSVVKSVLAEHKSYAVNPAIITFGGVSAGGNIALAVNHLCRDAGNKVKAVVVGTPTIADISQFPTAADAGKVYPSLGEMEFAPLLNWARLKWFDTLKWASLSQDNDVLRAEQEQDAGWFRDLMTAPNCENLADLTVVMTAECDPLRDEGEAYGNMIKSKGNDVIIKRFAGVPHPFQHMDAALPQASEFIEDTIQHVKSVQ